MADQKEQAKQDYLNGMKYKDIAEKYNVTLNTVKSWKTRYKWDRKSVHTNDKSMHTKKVGAPKGNKNAKGNGAPKGNTNNLKHGFFAKYLPAEALAIIEDIQDKSPADMIWDQIMMQYAAIVRAQKIMFVEDKNEMIKELKKSKFDVIETKDGPKQIPTEIEYEFQFAWDRHASFLTAQSRAMTALSSLIKQFDNIAHESDERRLRMEQMRLTIDKTKAEITKLSTDSQGEKDVAAALRGLVDAVNTETD